MKTKSLYILSSSVALLGVSNLWAQSFQAPDFNGDGRADLVQAYSADGALTLNVLESIGSRFKEKPFVDDTAQYAQSQRWFNGDFNGDGRSDIAVLFDDGGQMSCDVYLATDKAKSGFTKVAWAALSGAFSYADKWYVADFNGDGQSDLARVFSQDGKRSIHTYLSSEKGFATPQAWLTQSGDFHANDVWLTGNFDAELGADFAVVNEAETVSITVLASSGSAFVESQSYAGSNLRHKSIKWLAEDFSGDGVTDIAALWNDEGSVSIDLYQKGADTIQRTPWATKAAPFDRDHRWFVADFNGDAKVDIARLWNNDSELTVETFESNGAGFDLRMLLEKGVQYRDQNTYTVGDFNADGQSDLVVTWSDAKKRYDQFLISKNDCLKVSWKRSLKQSDYFSRHNIVKPIMGDKFTQYALLEGATPLGADLQAVLDSGNDLLLEQREIYDVSSTLDYQASYQRIATMDALFIRDYAMIRQNIDQGDFDSLIDGNHQSYIQLDSVMVNGNKYMLGQKSVQPDESQGAMVFFSHAEGVWVKRNVMFNARTWSTCHLVESGDAHGHIVEHNYVLGAGDDPRGSGKYVDQNGLGISPNVKVGWSDGFSISATNVTARYNFIMDCTDVGMVLFGAPGSHIHDNLILNFSRDNHGGLNFVDASAHRYIGTDTTFGKEYPLYEYRNNIIEDNRIVASGCRIQIGMPMGSRTWKRASPSVFDFGGGVIRNNVLEGDSFGYGYVMEHVINMDFYGNTSTATHSGFGRGTPANDDQPDEAIAFLWDPKTVRAAEGGQIQSDFVDNTKELEHLLFHNGTPQTQEKYHYYEYTPAEARDMVIASYLEMLGRAPTPTELEQETNRFLVDPKPETIINEAYKLYGDLFKRQLMETDEFITKFGNVKVQQLQSFRNARWRDRINVFDTESLLTTGNYADAKEMFDKVTDSLVWQPLREDAEIVTVEGLPTTLQQDQRVTISVQVKNTGKTTWQNTANNPRKIGLSTVGDDITLGSARSYIPDGIKVKPGESYTFEMKLFPSRIGYAGRGNAASTSFPYNLKMVHDSLGYFGETLTQHLGKAHRIDVAHRKEAMPIPAYNATFISQYLQGQPEINGIQPGAKFAVSLTFKNASTVTSTPWTKNNGFILGSYNEKDNKTWGTNRIAFDSWQEAQYGESVTLTSILTAPDEAGVYNFQWKMLGSGWFGETSKNLRITVKQDAPAISTIDANYVDVDVPKSVKAGQPFSLKATYKNSGEQTWEKGAPIYLNDAIKVVDETLQPFTYFTSQHNDSIPQEDTSKLFDKQTSTMYLTNHPSTWLKFHFAEDSEIGIDSYAITNTAEAGPGPEMIPSGDFEGDTSDWKYANSIVTDELAFSGSKSLLIESMQGESTGNTTITIPGLKPNTDYVLSFWMRQGADAQGTFAFDTNDVFDNTCQWVKHGGQPTEWTLFRGIFNTSVVDSEKKQKNPETLTLRIRASNLIGKIYVDAVSLAEVGGGGIEGDPHSWTLEGSNDDQTWSLVDEQKDFDFETRGQRAIFDLKQPQSFSIYKLTVQNRSGDALLFSEFELLSQAADQLLSEKSAATPVLSKGVAPGKSYVFEQQFIAPEKPGNYRIRLAMEKDGDAGSVRFGDSLPEQIITVSE